MEITGVKIALSNLLKVRLSSVDSFLYYIYSVKFWGEATECARCISQETKVSFVEMNNFLVWSAKIISDSVLIDLKSDLANKTTATFLGARQVMQHFYSDSSHFWNSVYFFGRDLISINLER